LTVGMTMRSSTFRMNSSSANATRADSTHTAGVQAGVTLADTLVVLCDGQYAVTAIAVCEDEDRTFDAFEELLDDDSGRRCAEHAAKHLAQRCAGLVERVDDEHTLSGGKAVGLEDIGRTQCLGGISHPRQACRP